MKLSVIFQDQEKPEGFFLMLKQKEAIVYFMHLLFLGLKKNAGFFQIIFFYLFF